MMNQAKRNTGKMNGNLVVEGVTIVALTVSSILMNLVINSINDNIAYLLFGLVILLLINQWLNECNANILMKGVFTVEILLLATAMSQSFVLTTILSLCIYSFTLSIGLGKLNRFF